MTVSNCYYYAFVLFFCPTESGCHVDHSVFYDLFIVVQIADSVDTAIALAGLYSHTTGVVFSELNDQLASLERHA